MPTAVVQTQSFTDPAGHGARLLAFDQHDPARGPLAGIRLEISAEVTGKLWVESHEGRAVALTYAPQATVTVFAPAGTRLEELSVAGEDTLALAAFDGTTDFAGPSGTRATTDTTVPAQITNLSAAGPDIAATTDNWFIRPPTASPIPPGDSTSDLTNGMLAVSFGTSELSSYLHITAT